LPIDTLKSIERQSEINLAEKSCGRSYSRCRPEKGNTGFGVLFPDFAGRIPASWTIDDAKDLCQLHSSA